MSKTKTKRYLVLLAAVGLVAAALGGTGTFASFNAEVTNAGNTFQTGAIVLSNKVDAASACFSSTGTGNVYNCGAVFLFTDWQPDGGTEPVKQLTLENTGSLPATLTWWAPLVTTTGATGGTLSCNYGAYIPSGATQTYVPVDPGNPCNALLMQIQETEANFSTLKPSCVFPSGGGECASFASLSTLSNTPTAVGSLNAGAKRYFLITIKHPAQGSGFDDNQYQSQQTHFDLTWHIQ